MAIVLATFQDLDVNAATVTLLDRDKIQEILHEQELQNLLAAGGTVKRPANLRDSRRQTGPIQVEGEASAVERTRNHQSGLLTMHPEGGSRNPARSLPCYGRDGIVYFILLVGPSRKPPGVARLAWNTWKTAA
jgi:hypothetical protein